MIRVRENSVDAAGFSRHFDGTSKGSMVVAIQKELGLPIKFIGLGEQPFDAKQFAAALFEE